MNETPRRGYHCEICHTCIKQYDHHCTWINNCVGKRNLARFILFLFFLILCLGLTGLLSFLAALSILLDRNTMYKEWFTLRFSIEQTIYKVLIIGGFAVCFIASLFIFPVITLFIVQIKNLLKNKTTFETVRGPVEESNAIKSKMRRYNSKMSLRNCKVMCADRGSFSTSQDSREGLLAEEDVGRKSAK